MNADDNSERVALPPLPYVAHQVLLATLDDRCDAEEITRRLGREPALAARVVAAANAAWFSGRAPIKDLQQAVVRLGQIRLRALVTGLLLAPAFDTRQCPSFDAAHFWRHSVATGYAADQLARHPQVTPGSQGAAVAGLLRNIGVLLLVHALPRETDSALRSRAGRPDLSLASHFREAAGVTPGEAAVMLLRAWDLPDAVIDAVSRSTTGQPRGTSTVSAIVDAAHAWADTAFEADSVTAGELPESAFQRCADNCRSEWKRLEGIARLLAT